MKLRIRFWSGVNPRVVDLVSRWLELLHVISFDSVNLVDRERCVAGVKLTALSGEHHRLNRGVITRCRVCAPPSSAKPIEAHRILA